jgi:hypothetical protein
MTTLDVVLLFLGACGVIVLVWRIAARAGYKIGWEDGEKEGREKGYQEGRIDADNWWLAVESEADRERQKIWQEEIERRRDVS